MMHGDALKPFCHQATYEVLGCGDNALSCSSTKTTQSGFWYKYALKNQLGINFRLTMAPNIPQCTLKMLVIQPGPPFHFNEVQIVKKWDSASKKVVRS